MKDSYLIFDKDLLFIYLKCYIIKLILYVFYKKLYIKI